MIERPYVLLSCAVSIDGYIDDTGPERLLLSNSEDLDRVDEVRAEVDAILIGATTVRRASPEFVRSHTGQPIGGVAPVGHPAPLPTLVDQALAQYDVIWAAAGIPRSIFPTTFEELVRLTKGTPAEVA